ncbi:MAG: hypothetical protein U1E15_08720 [Hyphomicrobiales bacterium]
MLVILEEAIELRKSKPVLVAAGLIWVLDRHCGHGLWHAGSRQDGVEHTILEYAELFLFCWWPSPM